MMYGVAVVVMGIITIAVLGVYWHSNCDMMALLRDMAGIERKPKDTGKSRIIHPYKIKREGGEDV